MKGTADLGALLKQRTWDKDVLLWLGSERSLLEALGPINHLVLDLLDLFVLDNLPVDDDETRRYLTEHLRMKLKSIAKGPDDRIVLVVKSIGLLARYKVGLKEFYDWFVGSYTVVILVFEDPPHQTTWPEEVRFEGRRLFDYFAEAGMVKETYSANG